MVEIIPHWPHLRDSSHIQSRSGPDTWIIVSHNLSPRIPQAPRRNSTWPHSATYDITSEALLCPALLCPSHPIPSHSIPFHPILGSKVIPQFDRSTCSWPSRAPLLEAISWANYHCMPDRHAFTPILQSHHHQLIWDRSSGHLIMSIRVLLSFLIHHISCHINYLHQSHLDLIYNWNKLRLEHCWIHCLNQWLFHRMLKILVYSCFRGCESLSVITFQSDLRSKRIEVDAFQDITVRSISIPLTIYSIACDWFPDNYHISVLGHASRSEFE
jgi:hypothetical protein